jgi:hypothetical protein
MEELYGYAPTPAGEDKKTKGAGDAKAGDENDGVSEGKGEKKPFKPVSRADRKRKRRGEGEDAAGESGAVEKTVVESKVVDVVGAKVEIDKRITTKQDSANVKKQSVKGKTEAPKKQSAKKQTSQKLNAKKRKSGNVEKEISAEDKNGVVGKEDAKKRKLEAPAETKVPKEIARVKMDKAPWKDPRKGGKGPSSHASPAFETKSEVLHPSWTAKRNESALVAPQGKKVVLD